MERLEKERREAEERKKLQAIEQKRKAKEWAQSISKVIVQQSDKPAGRTASDPPRRYHFPHCLTAVSSEHEPIYSITEAWQSH